MGLSRVGAGSTLLGLGAALLVGACGGGGGSPASPSATPSPSSSPPSGTPNPCTTALSEGLLAPNQASPAAPKGHGGLGPDVRRVVDSLWNHRYRGRESVRVQDTSVLTAEDVGNIAVIRDDGSVVVPANPFDLRGRGLRFQANGSGGYDVRGADPTFRPALGQRVSLGDDATTRTDVPFSFPFFGRSQTAAFVNSDGNVTFGSGDTATDERGLGRLLAGAPRVAPFFADLDPSAGGAVFVSAAADAFTVTWCAVPGFDSSDRVTAQTTLLPDGSVEMKLADTTTLGSAVVGLSPGQTSSFTPVDLSTAGSLSGGGGAVGERFAADAELDEVMLARRFYEAHPDAYDQLVVFSDSRVISASAGAFAFELNVRNDVDGIGQPLFDRSRDYGSQGRLASLVVMDRLSKYSDDPSARILGENTTLSILGQESGHEWLAQLLFRDANGQPSDALLGRDLVHWSFFLDSDASVMEGNDIQDMGGGSFRTVGAVSRYCLLDLYAMGLVDPGEVSPVFFVANPAGTSQDRASAPRVGLSFTGTRHDVTIQDIVSAMGPRRPSAARSPRVQRQAFVYLLQAGRTTDPSAEIQKLERIRVAWETFFTQATGNRMVLDASLR